MSDHPQTSSTDKPYQPLFNRSYLKYLAFIVAIAIVFLSEKPASPIDQPQLLSEPASNLKVLQVDDLPEQRLSLSFLSAPALTKEDRITRKVQYKALRQEAASLNDVHGVLWTQDRLEVELRWSVSEANIRIRDTLNLLFSKVNQGLDESQTALIKAQDYLQNKSVDEQLINQFKNSIAPNFLTTGQLTGLSYLDNTPLVALLITESDLTDKAVLDIDQQLAALNTQNLISYPDTLSWRAKEQHTVIRSPQHKLLIATELSTLSNLQSTLELVSNFVLSDLLAKTLANRGISYRLVRQPVYQHGFQLILLSSTEPISEPILQNIQQQLSDADISESLTAVKRKLRDQYEKLTEDQNRLFKLYSKKQFYGLTTQSSSEYEAQLDTISAEQVSAQINKLFKELTFTLRLQPS